MKRKFTLKIRKGGEGLIFAESGKVLLTLGRLRKYPNIEKHIRIGSPTNHIARLEGWSFSQNVRKPILHVRLT